MDKRRRKKLQSHKRGLALVNEHRTFLTGTPGGAATVANLDEHLADESAAVADQETTVIAIAALDRASDMGFGSCKFGDHQKRPLGAVLRSPGTR